jgi:hypothetical protein
VRSVVVGSKVVSSKLAGRNVDHAPQRMQGVTQSIGNY